MPRTIRWIPRNTEPGYGLDEMIENLWRHAWQGAPADNGGARQPVLRPALDVVESDEAVTVRVDLPGLSPDAVQVEIDGDLLTIRGEMGETDDDENARYHYRERRQGAFKRTLRLAETLDAANATATFENGVLSLVLPKLPETQPRRIEVKTG
jgi:HSP20 family protein